MSCICDLPTKVQLVGSPTFSKVSMRWDHAGAWPAAFLRTKCMGCYGLESMTGQPAPPLRTLNQKQGLIH